MQRTPEIEPEFAQNVALKAIVEALLAAVAQCIGGNENAEHFLELLREDVIERVEKSTFAGSSPIDDAAIRQHVAQKTRSIFDAASLALGRNYRLLDPHAKRYPAGREDGEIKPPHCLETFIADALGHLAARNYVPHEFLDLRDRVGLIQAITLCVEGDEMKCGFLRVLELGMVDWSLEAAVIRYPDQFTEKTSISARARLTRLDAISR